MSAGLLGVTGERCTIASSVVFKGARRRSEKVGCERREREVERRGGGGSITIAERDLYSYDLYHRRRVVFLISVDIES